jgi:hypothetical protein
VSIHVFHDVFFASTWYCKISTQIISIRVLVLATAASLQTVTSNELNKYIILEPRTIANRVGTNLELTPIALSYVNTSIALSYVNVWP